MPNQTLMDPMVAQVAVVARATSPAMLAEIAEHYPHLWGLVAAHPNAYPGLLDWLHENGDLSVQCVVEKRRAMVPVKGRVSWVPR